MPTIAGSRTGYTAWELQETGATLFGGVPSPPLDEPDVAAGLTKRKFSPDWAIRGRAAVAGSLPPNQPVPCNGPAAGLWIHDTLDRALPIENDVRALDLALQTNGCTGNYADGPKQPWAPAEDIPALAGGICQQYTGCPADVAKNYPLVFCTTSGLGHADQASSVVPAFTKFFDLMDPAP